MVIALIIPDLVSLIVQIIVVNIDTICFNINKTYKFPIVNEYFYVNGAYSTMRPNRLFM
jgi:hypothetical protein